MNEDEVNNLFVTAEKIINYFNKYGKLNWETSNMETIKKFPTKEVVTLNDYVSAFVNIKNAIIYIEKFNDQNSRKAQLIRFAEILKDIIVENVNIPDTMNDINECLDLLETEVGEAEDSDLFYYETACNFRESIEKKIYVLKCCFSIKKGQLESIHNQLQKVDRKFKNVQKNIIREYPDLKKPFPPKTFYIPQKYWWYIS